MVAFVDAVLLVGKRLLAMVGILVRHPRKFIRWVALTDPREQFFKFTHPRFSRYAHYLRSVYTKCQHPARPVDLQEAFDHLQECSRCGREFEFLVGRESFFTRGRRSIPAVLRVTSRTLTEIGILDELFEEFHPELLDVIPAIQSAYVACTSSKPTDPYPGLEVAWQHVTTCDRCMTEVQSYRRRSDKIANEPVYTES